MSSDVEAEPDDPELAHELAIDRLRWALVEARQVLRERQAGNDAAGVAKADAEIERLELALRELRLKGPSY